MIRAEKGVALPIFFMKFIAGFLFLFLITFASPAWASFDNFDIAKDCPDCFDGWYVLSESEISNPYNKWRGLSLDFLSSVEKPTPVFIRRYENFVNDGVRQISFEYRQGDKLLEATANRPNIDTIPPDYQETAAYDSITVFRYRLLGKFCDGDIVNCITGKLRSKFPFDVFLNLPPSRITCPALTISLIGESRTFDLCWIYEAMRPLKYAVAMSLLIKLFIHS